MKQSKPYLPVATFQQVIDYVPGQAETYTPSPIVNAVAEALYETKCIESKELAEYLNVEARKLACAIQLDMGMRLIDVIQQYRIHQIQEYRKANPKSKLDDVAQAFGYSDRATLWRFFQRKLNQTVDGKKSNAGPERWIEILKMNKERRERYLVKNHTHEI